MRRIVGILGLSIGILLPLAAAILSQCFVVQESISHYYYTISGDIFVGLLCSVGFFLIMYPGEGKWEDLWTNIAGICALCVAFFPTSYDQKDNSCTKFSFEYLDWVSSVHLISAGAFFIILGGVAIFQFPKTVVNNEDPLRRRNRNRFYRICGVIMWIAIAVLIPMKCSDSYAILLADNKVIFIAEVLAVVSFGICWLIKGFVLKSSK